MKQRVLAVAFRRRLRRNAGKACRVTSVSSLRDESTRAKPPRKGGLVFFSARDDRLMVASGAVLPQRVGRPSIHPDTPTIGPADSLARGLLAKRSCVPRADVKDRFLLLAAVGISGLAGAVDGIGGA